MSEIEMIGAALLAGATAGASDVGRSVAMDTYRSFKTRVAAVFGVGHSDIDLAVESGEDAVAELLSGADVIDSEIVRAAAEILEYVAVPSNPPAKYSVAVQKSDKTYIGDGIQIHGGG